MGFPEKVCFMQIQKSTAGIEVMETLYCCFTLINNLLIGCT